MKTSKLTSRLLSLVLCLCMVLSLVPGIPLVTAQAAGTQGMITIEMTDSYGDGWNGNAIEIYENGELLDTATIADRVTTGTWTGKLDPHRTYTLQWVAGRYANETSFVIYAGEEEKLSADGKAYRTGDTLLTLDAVCAEADYDDTYCCVNCGNACVHSGFEASVCTTCGYVCQEHSWDQGVCTLCAAVCPHDSVENSVCTNCGFVCGTDAPHSLDSTHICTTCGFVYEVPAVHRWNMGVCTVCAEPCAHTYDSQAICTICKFGTPAEDADEDGYVDIATVGNLYWFADQVNNGNNQLKAELVADIVINPSVLNPDGTLNGDGSNLRPWTPIGNESINSVSVYKGVFDGNDHTISGLYCTGLEEYLGLFGCVDDATIKNVSLLDSYIRNGGDPCYAAAGIVGLPRASTIRNCHNAATVTNTHSYAAGIVGQCWDDVIITQCSNSGKVTAYGHSGGIGGYINPDEVSYCYNTGDITTTGTYSNCGGILGYGSGLIKYCYNTGKITGKSYVGGIGGCWLGTMEGCFSTGAVQYALVGLVNSNTTVITNCYYNSDVCEKMFSVEDGTITNSGGLTSEQFRSGEACWLLNGSTSDGDWKQTLGTDLIPDLTGDTVYQVDGISCDGSATDTYVNNTSITPPVVHPDADSNHICDLCGETVSECLDSETNGDHLCDLCGAVMSECADSETDTDHACDVCGEILSECADSEDDADHACDVCGKILSECADSEDDWDHACDVCGKIVTVCADSEDNADHACDTCGEIISECMVGEPTYEWIFYDDGTGYAYVDLECSICGAWVDGTSGEISLIAQTQGTDCTNPSTETWSFTYTLGEAEVTKEYIRTIPSDNHAGEFVNGFCSACGSFEEPQWNEEDYVYEISNAGQLYWYAQELNTNNSEIHVKLMNDIVIPENAPNWTPISASYAYFDGNFKTISGLKCIGGENDTYVGFFGNEVWWYEIRNLHIADSYFEGSQYVGGVVACLTNGGSVTNCYVTNTTVKGGEDGDIGGIVGYLVFGTVENCYTDSVAAVGYWNSSYGSVINCYYLSETETEDGGKTAAQFASGEVAYLLQSGIQGEEIYDEESDEYITLEPVQVWGQTVGEEDYPTFGGEKVYLNLNCGGEVYGYANEAVTMEHSFAQGVCQVCGKSYTYAGEADGDWTLRNVKEPTYWTAGDGYVYFNPEAKVLTLENATMYPEVYGSEDAAAVWGDDLTINFMGTNTLTSNANYHGCVLQVDGAVVMNGIGENAVLNFCNGYIGKDYYESEVEVASFGSLTVNSGTVNFINGNGAFATALRTGTGLTVAQGAVMNVVAGNATNQSNGILLTGDVIIDGTLNASYSNCSDPKAPLSCGILTVGGQITGSGTVNAVAMILNDKTMTLDTVVYGDAVLATDWTAYLEEGVTCTFTVTEGATLTVPEGVTLDLTGLKEENISINGTIVNEGSVNCNHSAEADDGDCTTDVMCTICGLVAIPGNAQGHFEPRYTIHEDTHDVDYLCCDAADEKAVPHSFEYGFCICGAANVIAASDLKFFGASLTLENDLTVNLIVDKQLLDANGYSQPYAVVEMGGRKTVIRNYTVQGDKYVLPFENVFAHQMNDTMTITLYAVKDGVEYVGDCVTYSVASYCYNMLSRCSDDSNAQLRTLLVDMLNYGAAAQNYVGYNQDLLVNNRLTDVQKAWGTAENRQWSTVLDTEYEEVPEPSVNWIGAGLVLKKSIEMRFKFKAESVDGLTVKIKKDDGTEKVITTFEETDGGYCFYYSDLTAPEMSKPVYVTIYDGDTAVSNTVCYSVESYAYSKQADEDLALVKLLEAIMKYGDAAYAYCN